MSAKKTAERFRVIEESTSAHCCFGFTVVDTAKPMMIGRKHYANENGPQFEAVCECFEKDAAEMIANALNRPEA